MLRVFISNNKDVATNGFHIAGGFVAAMLPSNDKYQVGNTIFVIDVHCTFKGSERMQFQGGVIIYRHLLKQFEKFQDQLKVIFYSPISKEDLVRLRPENYVLQLLPFVECKYEAEQFENDLADKIAKYQNEGWPQFNNASENLLSGWAKMNENAVKAQHNLIRIKTAGKLIQFIDDQQSEWKLTFDTIFEENSIVYCMYAGKHIRSQQDFRTEVIEKWDRFKKVINDKAVNHEFDIILSDFYIKENHEITEWKNRYKLSKISGYEIFQEIRSKIPATPYIFHTSSNKATTYKFFDSKGIDEWVVKDVEPDSPHKSEYFNFFRSVIEDCASNPLYGLLAKLWERIEKIESGSNFWWEYHLLSKSISDSNILEIRTECISILKNSWLAIRHLINKEVEFEEGVSELAGHHQFDQNNFYATAIIGNLYKIIEGLKFYDIPKAFFNCTPLKLIDVIRNAALHNNNKDNKYLNIDDCTIFIQLLTDILLYQGSETNVNGDFPQFIISQKSGEIKYRKLKSKQLEDYAITQIIQNPENLPVQYNAELNTLLNFEPESSNKMLRFSLLWAYLTSCKKSKVFKQDTSKNQYWSAFIFLFEKRIEAIINSIKANNELADFCAIADVLFEDLVVIKEEGKLVDFNRKVIVNKFG